MGWHEPNLMVGTCAQRGRTALCLLEFRSCRTKPQCGPLAFQTLRAGQTLECVHFQLEMLAQAQTFYMLNEEGALLSWSSTYERPSFSHNKCVSNHLVPIPFWGKHLNFPPKFCETPIVCVSSSPVNKLKWRSYSLFKFTEDKEMLCRVEYKKTDWLHNLDVICCVI